MEIGNLLEKECEMETQQFKMTGDASVRHGVYANLTSARTSPKETILDFYFVDGIEVANDSNALTGVLQARVILSNDSLIELTEMLRAHVESHFEKVNGDDE